ncbi:hypothetical protein Q5P01_000547 [Channa striata]|uniref:Uncharacterized protein n=1 Tax=Channa striata TaxID=64152 RepID=A0AA88IDW1_CHASR|nr:hypothetical protein Q5P01_000547 [Channa striata]
MLSTRIYGPIHSYTHGLSERKDSSALVPYGSYTYDLAKSYLPGGLFHFVKDGDTYVPTRVNCEYGGDPVEEAIQAIKREPDFDVFRLISPYEPQSVLSMMSLIANGADHHLVPEGTRRMAANAVNGAFDANAVALVVQDEQAKRFLRTVIGHAMTIVESVQGFAGGQVIRACSGYNTSRIRTGERFMAQLNVNRWLL